MSDISSVPSRPVTPVTGGTPDILPTARPYRFTWDPASRRPGPESVSGFTEGRGDDFSGPHPLAFLNTSTTSLALGSLPSEWSSSRTGFHAISTMLNNPHKRQAPPKAHSTLPSVPPADLPRVRRKDFESYLRAVAPEWDRYEHNSQLGREGLAQIDASQHTPRNSISGEEPPTPTPPLLPPSLQGKQIPPLDSVPSVFFQKDFSLADPKTFADVTEQDAAAALLASDDDSFADPFSLSHSLPLMEKFSHYADTVEQHLVREIFIRSTSFFAALTNLHDLQSESERCLDRITKLRKELQDVDNNGAKRGLEMVRKESKMANLGKVWDGVKVIHEVVEMTGVAKSLVNAGQWGQALGVIEDVENMWDVQEQPKTSGLQRPPLTGRPKLQNGHGNGNGHGLLPPTPEEEHEDDERPNGMFPNPNGKYHQPHYTVPLSSLHAFSSLPSHLRQLTMEIAASLSNELVSVLRNDLELRINSDGPPKVDGDQGLKDVLKPLLLNLVRTKGLKEGMLSWREVVLVEVRGVMKKILPAFEPDEYEDSRDSSKSEARAGLANHLRSMQHTDFVLLLQKIYLGLFNAVEGLHQQGQIIVEILTSLGSELQQKITNIPAVEEDLADIVSSTAELSNTQAAKVISFRSEQHAALELADFLTFFNDSWAFVIKCETLCRRMIVGLRGTVVGQAKLFLQAFHQARISQSAKLVEDELWNPTEITPGLQRITNIIVDSAVRDAPDLVIKTEETIFSPYATTFPSPAPNGTSAGITPSFQSAIDSSNLGLAGPPTASGPPTRPGVSSPPTTTNSKQLRIEERTYYAVAATTEVLSLLLDYLRVVVNLSLLTTDTMSRVIEFLKAFNSRTCQVVLGAGAMRSAGLKNITAKHLALASQSLSIIFELIPYVRETFRRHLSQKQAVMLVEFDKLKRDYQEHQNEIHSKLIAIMGDRLNAHIKSLKTVDWAVPKPGGGINDYMEILVKETATLYKVLSRYLAPPVVEYVMTQVFAAINHRLSEEYAAIELPHQEAKERLLADAKYLHQKLAVLKNVGAPTGMLETVVTDKPLGRAGTVDSNNAQGGLPSSNNAPPNPPTRSNTLSTNQRLKGLMSGRRSSFMTGPADKALPPPLPPVSSTPPPPPPASDKPKSPAVQVSHQQPLSVANIYGVSSSQDQLGSGSQLSLPDGGAQTISTPSGFRQIENPSPLLEGAANARPSAGPE